MVTTIAVVLLVVVAFVAPDFLIRFGRGGGMHR